MESKTQPQVNLAYHIRTHPTLDSPVVHTRRNKMLKVRNEWIPLKRLHEDTSKQHLIFFSGLEHILGAASVSVLLF